MEGGLNKGTHAGNNPAAGSDSESPGDRCWPHGLWGKKAVDPAKVTTRKSGEVQSATTTPGKKEEGAGSKTTMELGESMVGVPLDPTEEGAVFRRKDSIKRTPPMARKVTTLKTIKKAEISVFRSRTGSMGSGDQVRRQVADSRNSSIR